MWKTIKGLFKKNDKQEITEAECEMLRMENKAMRDELKWFESLGLPSKELFEEGFDYYEHLKEQVLILRRDKGALVSKLVSTQKKLSRMEAIEEVYLREIKELRNKSQEIKALLSAYRANAKKERDTINQFKKEVKKREEYRKQPTPEKEDAVDNEGRKDVEFSVPASDNLDIKI